MKYHPNGYGYLTASPQRGSGQRMVGSLTGAVASQKVTEAPKGSLRVDGNHPCERIGAGWTCYRQR